MNRVFKNAKRVACIALASAALTSCADDFFEVPISSTITMETVFENMYNAERAVNAVYTIVPYNWAYSAYESVDISSGYHNGNKLYMDLMSSMCDESLTSSTWSGVYSAYYGAGTISPLTVGIDAATKDRDYVEYLFEEPYCYIRRAYLVLENIDTVSDATEEWKSAIIGECKLLIAMGYYELIIRHGSVPYVDKVLTALTADETRPALKDIINKVDGLIEDALNSELIDRYYQDDMYYGKVSKATAHFLRARLWLFAASPLFNTNVPYIADYSNPELVCMMNAEGGAEWTETWQKAIDYTADAIDFIEGVGFTMMQPTESRDAQETYTIATRELDTNTEIVQFSRRVQQAGAGTSNYNMYGRNYPPRPGSTSQQATSWTQPTHNLVSKFRTVDGEPLNLDCSNPWENLEPRFHASIVYDFCEWGGSVINTSKGDQWGSGLDKWATGYYLRKFLWEDQYITTSTKKDPIYIVMRLPELYLNYAEALNELYPGDAKIAENINKVTDRIFGEGVRRRDLSGSQDEVREEIRDERSAELVFEDSRYFDCIRWKIAAETIGGTKYGVIRTGEAAATAENITYTVIECDPARSITWSDKRYLMPFPQNEIDKGVGLIQNPGY